MALSRDAILAAVDLETREVDVPEWGGTVLVRGLSGTERDSYEASTTRIRNGEMEPVLVNARAKLVARVVVDEAGDRVFTDQDVTVLGAKSASALQRVFEAALELSGMTQPAVEEAEGNSDAADSGASTSNSPENSDTP